MKSEAEVLTNRILKYLEYLSDGCVAWRNKTRPWKRRSMGSADTGAADILCCFEGRHIEIEIKIGADKQSQVQIDHQAKIETAGGLCLVVKNIDQFISDFKRKLGLK